MIAKIYQIVYTYVCNIVHDCDLSICFPHDQILQGGKIITYVGARVGAVERAGTRIGSTVLVGEVKKLQSTFYSVRIIVVKPSDRTSGIDSV